MLTTSAQDFYARALAALSAGDKAGALVLLRQGLAAHPGDAALWHGAGVALGAQGDWLDAADHFARAAEIAPRTFEHALEQARALIRAGRHKTAARVLARIEKKGAKNAEYCTRRGDAERGAGNPGAAVKWFERALELEPHRVAALLGRADTALERAEPDAVQWFDRALKVDPGNPAVWLGKAQALDFVDDRAGALTIMRQVAAQAPGYSPGLRYLAQLRQSAGEEKFASHYADAARAMPQDPNIRDGWARALAGFGFNAEAAEVAASARKDWPGNPHLALLEAAYAGAAGEHERAEAIYAALDLDTADRWADEARHRIRRGELAAAEAALDKALARAPEDIGAWALRDIVWRLSGDERSHWLHGQDGLIRVLDLGGRRGLVEDLVAELRTLHAGAAQPIGQSVRGGTQTRGRLLAFRGKPFVELARALGHAVEDYRAALPPPDPAHPLLRHRDADWRFEGSWSVRFTGGEGHHAAHIHPNGILSSALYLAVPEAAGDGAARQGWLELGSAPEDLGIDLEPLARIEPKAGKLVLFPSTLYHGTTAFSGPGERITAVFDVVLG